MEPTESSPPSCRGRVQHILRDRGFGFIRCLEGEHEGKDFFFHATGLQNADLQTLEEGSIVRFEVRQVPKGLRAERIEVER